MRPANGIRFCLSWTILISDAGCTQDMQFTLFAAYTPADGQDHIKTCRVCLKLLIIRINRPDAAIPVVTVEQKPYTRPWRDLSSAMEARTRSRPAEDLRFYTPAGDLQNCLSKKRKHMGIMCG